MAARGREMQPLSSHPLHDVASCASSDDGGYQDELVGRPCGLGCSCMRCCPASSRAFNNSATIASTSSGQPHDELAGGRHNAGGSQQQQRELKKRQNKQQRDTGELQDQGQQQRQLAGERHAASSSSTRREQQQQQRGGRRQRREQQQHQQQQQSSSPSPPSTPTQWAPAAVPEPVEPPKWGTRLADRSTAAVSVEAHYALPPTVLFDLLADPNQHASIFDAIESADAELLEEDGAKRKWRLDYRARWSFWKVSGIAENRMWMWTDREAGTVTFKLREPGFLKRYEGTWTIKAACGTPLPECYAAVEEASLAASSSGGSGSGASSDAGGSGGGIGAAIASWASSGGSSSWLNGCGDDHDGESTSSAGRGLRRCGSSSGSLSSLASLSSGSLCSSGGGGGSASMRASPRSLRVAAAGADWLDLGAAAGGLGPRRARRSSSSSFSSLSSLASPSGRSPRASIDEAQWPRPAGEAPMWLTPLASVSGMSGGGVVSLPGFAIGLAGGLATGALGAAAALHAAWRSTLTEGLDSFAPRFVAAWDGLGGGVRGLLTPGDDASSDYSAASSVAGGGSIGRGNGGRGAPSPSSRAALRRVPSASIVTVESLTTPKVTPPVPINQVLKSQSRGQVSEMLDGLLRAAAARLHVSPLHVGPAAPPASAA